MKAGISALVRRLVADEAVVVVPLVLARPVRKRRLRPRPADQPLVDGKAAEHAARRVGAREDGDARDPGAGERVRRLEPARPAADDDDVVVAGREGALVYPGHTLALRSRWTSAWSIRSITLGCSSRKPLSCGPGTTRQRRTLVATTSAVGGSPVKSDISPKKSPRPRRARSSPSIATRASPSRIR